MYIGISWHVCEEGVDLYRVGVDVVNVWAELLEELLNVVENFVRGRCLGCMLGFRCRVLMFCVGFGVPSGVVDCECVVVRG